MTRICVDTTLLASASQTLRRDSESLHSHADVVGTVLRSLDWEIVAGEHYEAHLIRLQAEFLRESRLLDRHAAFLSFAASSYENVELKLIGLSGPKTGGLLTALGGLIATTFGRVVGGRILDFSRVFAAQGLVVAVGSLGRWVLSPTIVDWGKVKQGLMDSYLKVSLWTLHYHPEHNQAAWDKADLEGRKKILESLAAEAAGLYGVSGKVEFFNESPNKDGLTTLGYNDGSGTIHLNEYAIKNGSYAGAMNTVFHELRHQYQSDSLKNPDHFLVDDQTLDVWKGNFNDYKTAEEDGFPAYQGQPIEEDARDFEVG